MHLGSQKLVGANDTLWMVRTVTHATPKATPKGGFGKMALNMEPSTQCYLQGW